MSAIDASVKSRVILTRHCEERSDEAIQESRDGYLSRDSWIASLRSQ
jgi:hypothetical protein